ncbi:nicotinamide riboside transporter PnuC [Legionella clemsonensis]|uniref:Nicotinamide riboside transporter PnuC n=1 Tax=Legionella clemsonensis TaxID=1867846 RepID=A0A222P0W9_9GAMM|nr:nicotinamide riboside transporter PnuC [Legionella clemsonensis]ASQ45471.1 Nicotinamide riboside transporter PnuC [Legionella clemsonensis]
MLLDIVGTVASLLATYYFIQISNKAWPVSLLATLINGLLYWQKGIYADMALESFYFFSTCYGWYLWRSSNPRTTKIITKLSTTQWLVLTAVTFALFLFIANLLKTFTRSDIAILDSLTTSLSLAAQWLMCYKLIATWILWFLTDAVYSYLYFQKQLPFHSLLMLVYTIMAIAGYRSWAKRQDKLPLSVNNSLNLKQ